MLSTVSQNKNNNKHFHSSQYDIWTFSSKISKLLNFPKEWFHLPELMHIVLVIHGSHLIMSSKIRRKNIFSTSLKCFIIDQLNKIWKVPDIAPYCCDISGMKDKTVSHTFTQERSKHRKEHVESPGMNI